uniref:NACHT domain-containing protein n=1 Tax=Amphimedon queenslandica TaxID=400682 RepID=A0A1X7T6C3_AMPQE
MIDVSQWRASIGLWNYCQAASSRPANGRHSHSFKAAVDSKSGSTTSGEKTSKLPAALSLIVSLPLRYMKLNFIPPTGKETNSIITVTVMIHCLQSLVLFIATIGSSSDLIYYLVLLLLLSGDVELNPGPITGNPKDILRTHSDKLVHAISVNLYSVTDALYAKELIPQQTKQDMHVQGLADNKKASKLVNIIEQQLESSLNPEQYFIDICHVLINQQHRTLTDIATSILHQLGQSILDNVTSISSIPDDVQGYADNMRQHYKHQPIVAIDWPPRIGKDFFGRLALVEKQDYSTQAELACHMLRGKVDEIVEQTENKEISAEDVLQPTDSSLSLRVVIDGPPGIGKTTLCRKLLNMWSNGPLVHQQYDLVLYCPLRDSKIATATTLADLFEYRRYEVPMVVKWIEKRNGEGLLIIFDGWDELSEQLRQSSLAASIIHRKQLDKCSVIVTSRSYASSSLLKMDTLSRHVQVIGFSKEEISTVIVQTLQKDTKLAQELIYENTEQDTEKAETDKKYKTTKVKYKFHFKTVQSSKESQLAVKLINDLKVRNDVQSLCYVPLVCSMVILVYCKEGGHLPTTLTQLYENFILQTIKRHVEIKPRHGIDPYHLDSVFTLPSQLAKHLQEMCKIAYTNLANTRMTFTAHQLQSLSEEVKEHYLGLITTFIEYDEKKYQFLHLSIQEFLAGWWIAKHEKNTEEVFNNHFDDDHFKMCLRTLRCVIFDPMIIVFTCYCGLGSKGQYDPCSVLLLFFRLPQLKLLHVTMTEPIISSDFNKTCHIDKCTELEKCIEMNLTLQEMKFEYREKNEISSTIISVIRGVTRNKTITSLTLHVYASAPPLPDGVIEQLLKDNNTLQALSLNVSDELLPSSLNVIEINIPLTALEIRKKMMTLLLPRIKGLHCLVLGDPYLPYPLFLSHPKLHTLTVLLDTAESVIELFTILQTNTTLKALSVEIKEGRVYTSNMGTSLQDMLTQNNTLKCFEIVIQKKNNNFVMMMLKDIPIPSSFLSFLTTGLKHNTTLQQLSVSIPFIPLNNKTNTFINVISQKNNLTDIKVDFKRDESYSNYFWGEKEQRMTPLFYEQVLPAITYMLQSHKMIRLLTIQFDFIKRKLSQPNWIKLVQHLYETIFIHPSLEYIKIQAEFLTAPLLVDTYNNQRESLIERHRKEQPHKPLPIVQFNEIEIF